MSHLGLIFCIVVVLLFLFLGVAVLLTLTAYNWTTWLLPAFEATENARPENAGLENDRQLRKESQGLENAGLENDGQHFSKL